MKRQLEKDIEMGIFQRAPIGKSTEWCMRMITVSKVDGTEGGGNSQWKLCIHVYTPPPLPVTGKIKKIVLVIGKNTKKLDIFPLKRAKFDIFAQVVG